MRVFNGHSDMLSDVTIKRLNGEKRVFANHHYDGFLKSQVKGAIWVVWTDPEHFDDPPARVEEIIRCMQDEFAESADIINPVRTFADYQKGLQDQRVNVLVGMEGLRHIGKDLDLLETYYREIGLRHASLTWNEENDLASGVSNPDGSLTEYGRRAIERMEALGILVDVSHLNEKGFWELTEVAKGPIIASHSNAKHFAEVARNLTDAQIKTIGERDGLVCLNAINGFVSDQREKRNLDGLVEQIQYVINLAGEEHVGFGFDFCDFLPVSYAGRPDPETGSTTVEGLSSEADVTQLLETLHCRGVAASTVEKIAYANWESLLKEIL